MIDNKADDVYKGVISRWRTGMANIEIIEFPAGNGTKLPYAVKIDGEYVRTAGGVARRFKTEDAARKFAEKE